MRKLVAWEMKLFAQFHSSLVIEGDLNPGHPKALSYYLVPIPGVTEPGLFIIYFFLVLQK